MFYIKLNFYRSHKIFINIAIETCLCFLFTLHLINAIYNVIFIVEKIFSNDVKVMGNILLK